MQIFCDESGGTDPANELFLAAAVVLPASGATRLLKSFRKAARWGGAEVKGHLLTPGQRRVFSDLLGRQDELGSVVVGYGRRDPVGGWAMGALPEPELYGHLLQEACPGLVRPASRHVTITPDGGRYKKAELGAIAARLAEVMRGHGAVARKVTVSFEGSATLPGLQVADVVANTAFQALGTTTGAVVANGLLEPLRATGRLVVRPVELAARRPAWLGRGRDAEKPPEGGLLVGVGGPSLVPPE